MTTGTIIPATHLDSLRITRADGTTLQIPAACLLAAADVLRYCHAEEEDLDLSMVSDDDTGEEGWQAHAGNAVGAIRPTPWAAMLSLAKEACQQ